MIINGINKFNKISVSKLENKSSNLIEEKTTGFLAEGGFSERLYRIRSQKRKSNRKFLKEKARGRYLFQKRYLPRKTILSFVTPTA